MKNIFKKYIEQVQPSVEIKPVSSPKATVLKENMVATTASVRSSYDGRFERMLELIKKDDPSLYKRITNLE